MVFCPVPVGLERVAIILFGLAVGANPSIEAVICSIIARATSRPSPVAAASTALNAGTAVSGMTRALVTDSAVPVANW
ncbi:MAG: hypothetical protein ACRC2R_22240 [Xenococcaceae cyanobacterium]